MLKTIISSCCLLFASTFGFETTVSWTVPLQQASVFFTIPVEPEDALYKEYMDFSTDQDAATITSWSTHEDAVAVYDPVFKETKKIFPQDTTFKLDLTIRKPIQETTIRVTYYRKSKGCIEEQLVHIPIAPTSESQPQVETTADVQESIIHEDIQEPANAEPKSSTSWSCTVSDLIKHTQSVWLQCLLILLLGALLSLTPCIYPMIPITVGILQGQGSKSFWRNLLLSGCYTMGIAMTFATLGLTAAYTGKLFGTFMQSPIVIGFIVALLVYLAGSMLGLYEMYTPKFLSANSRYTQGGSPLSAFIFGVVSGTVASPCVSPGLALVLSIVTGLANPILGFLFLFAFGIGLSLPLLIIGTFSSSLNLLPRAGVWMVEIKKVFGFLLLGMALYFLSIILPPFVSTWLLMLLTLNTGVYYLYANKQQTGLWRLLYNIFGIAFVAGSIIIGYFALRATANPQDCSIVGLWTTDYACAREQAKHEEKLLLLKVDAPCCSLCTAIDKKFLQQQPTIAVLDSYYIPVRIDGGDSTNPTTARLIKQFNIIGFPTIIIVDPAEEQVITTWGSELYDYSMKEFIEELSLIPISKKNPA